MGELHQRIRRGNGYSARAVTTAIDSQSVKAAETVGQASRGYDAAKHVNGRKRGLVVDLGGWPLLIMVFPASMTDREIGRELLCRLRCR